MIEEFNKIKTTKELEKLSSSKQLLFGVIIAHRLIDCYLEFIKKQSYGNHLIVINALNELWSHVTNEVELSSKRAQELVADCENQAPDSDDFGDMEATFAQNSIFAICCVLDYFISSDSERIAQACSYIIDTVDYLIQELEDLDSNDINLEEKISSHILMQEELSLQLSEIDQIAMTKLRLDELSQKSRAQGSKYAQKIRVISERK